MSDHDHLGPAPGRDRAMEYRGRPAGTFAAMPRGIILHGSRSGRAGNPLATEYLGTCRYVVNNPAGLAWHVTIGPDVWSSHLAPQEWGWHAREHSQFYIGVEFAQPTVDDAITDGQVAAFAAWYRREINPAWPGLNLLLPAHSEMPAGKRDGKTDPFPTGDARLDDLRRRLYAAVGQESNPFWSQIGPGLAAAIRQRGDEPMGPERFVHDPDRPGQNITSHVDGKQRSYTYHHDAKRVSVRSYEPLTPPG